MELIEMQRLCSWAHLDYLDYLDRSICTNMPMTALKVKWFYMVLLVTCKRYLMQWTTGHLETRWNLTRKRRKTCGSALRWLPRVLFPGVTFFVYM
jgi:hypothetical protein